MRIQAVLRSVTERASELGVLLVHYSKPGSAHSKPTKMAQNLIMLMVQIHLMTVAAYRFIMTWIKFMETSLTRPPKVMIGFGFSYVVFIFI